MVEVYILSPQATNPLRQEHRGYALLEDSPDGLRASLLRRHFSAGDEVPLRVGSAPIQWIRTGLLTPPLLAATLAGSRLVRDQSIAASAETVQKSTMQPAPHSGLLPVTKPTPAKDFARGTPLQPTLRGSMDQGMPVSSTWTIPDSTSRSHRHGLPPLDFGGSAGNNDFMIRQGSSLIRFLAVGFIYLLNTEAGRARSGTRPTKVCWSYCYLELRALRLHSQQGQSHSEQGVPQHSPPHSQRLA